MAVHVVTGAAGALGAAVAESLLSRGDRVAAVDLAQAGQRLAALAAAHGAACLPVPLDGTDGGAWGAALAGIEHDLGPVDGAALVAGGWRGGRPLHEEDEAIFQAMLDMNLVSAYRALHALLPGMVARGRGSIVIVASRAAAQPWTSAGASSYAASKAAVAALVQSVAAEVVSSGVRINAVLPSVIDTPANRGAMPDADPTRWVSPASLASVMSFLLSDAARDVTGALVPVYGRALRQPAVSAEPGGCAETVPLSASLGGARNGASRAVASSPLAPPGVGHRPPGLDPALPNWHGMGRGLRKG